jgi:hypothetical protein
MDMSLKEKAKKFLDPLKWGLRLKAINDLGKRLKSFWERYSFFLKQRQAITVITGTGMLVVC